MHIHKRAPFVLTYCLIFTSLLSSCYKKDIQVGSELAESHTRIITVDTIGVVLSSYVLDSFITANNNVALIGNYHDSYLGNTTASTFFQPGLPTLSEDAATLLPKSAVYDSIVLYMKPNGYYYGDTTVPYAISVYDLAAQPSADADRLEVWNKSNVPVSGGPIASFSRPLRPNVNDSVVIALPWAKGKDFFDKIQSKDTRFSSQDLFLDYFKGLSVRPTTSAAGAVYGFNLTDSSIKIRLHYHLSLPYKQDKVIEFFPTRTTYQFNRIVTDRSGTPLQPTSSQQQEFFATTANPYSFMQTGTGVYLKAKFPTLRDVLKINEVVRLIDARLVMKPVKGTYDKYGQRLPGPVSMRVTDLGNLAGSALLDTTGQQVQERFATIDDLYGINTTYTFNITSYINALLNTAGTAENGIFFLQQDPNRPTEINQINRAIIGSLQNENYQTKLILNILTIE
jgi:hypothetical protein